MRHGIFILQQFGIVAAAIVANSIWGNLKAYYVIFKMMIIIRHSLIS